jgi:hypothetical protein
LHSLETLLANRRRLTPFVGTGATIAVLPNNPHARWNDLLEDGVRACEELGQSVEWGESTIARLRSGDVITYLSIADEISRRLAAATNEWSNWIERTVGSISVPGGSAMHAAICKLNRIVLTTNYDCLLEEASRYKGLTWLDIAEVRRVTTIEERRRAVIHLHGVATRPETVVLGSWQYQSLQEDQTAQFWQSVLLTRRLLFIGCGSGLHDPNIGPALEFVRLRSQHQRAGSEDNPDEHYILVRGPDLGDAREEFRGTDIVPIAYGADYPDLEPFLIELGGNGQPRPSQNVHTYRIPSRSTPKRGLLDLAGPAEEALQASLDVARRALQALGQVERRSALPYGVDRWAYADQLYIHERTAASLAAPIARLQGETTALALAVHDADAPIGLLTGQQEHNLTALFALVGELSGLCNDLAERVRKRIIQVRGYSQLTDDYRPVATALQEIQSLAEDIHGTVESLPRA